ncbi:MAG: 3-methyl-2-oxobutanoate hydroxymethyltransferase [Anaerolineae bacterium]|nr:3-methyl-2-oxobutanoate hydroxymethyltransferase [Anaerolineae bacterium]
MRRKTTILTLQKMYQDNRPISMVTAYDFTAARLADSVEIDIILVGDSLGMVMMGLDSTVAVTMDEMLHHCRMVVRGNATAFVIGDMPFLSYEVSSAEAVRNAGRFMKESGVDAVKLEGGREMVKTIRAIIRAGIPVMGHIGLTPQSVSKLGGYRVQGKSAESAQALLDDAYALQNAGCFAVVLEAVPAPVAAAITERLNIPTIGIGAGGSTSGQVLVWHDMLGLHDNQLPRFVKQYAQLGNAIKQALTQYREDVGTGDFPAVEHTYPMPQEELDKFLSAINS